MSNNKALSKLGMAFAISTIIIPIQRGVAAEGQAKDCLQLLRVDHSSVVDDQNILFYLKNGDIYLNHLAHPAIGLDANQPFMHETTIGQICRNDTITVLEERVFGFMRGASSTLGSFEPIDEARAQRLMSGEAAPVESEPVEAE